MPLSGRWTLTRYLIEERRRFPQASGELNALILDIAIACKAIARLVAQGSLGDLHGQQTLPTPQMADEVFMRLNEWNGHLAGIAAAKDAVPRQVPASHPRGKYLLLFDALDGAGNLDINAPVGSIFAIQRAGSELIDAGRDVAPADFLQAGRSLVAAGYAIYGPTTMLVLSVGNGAAGFTLNPNLGEFVLTTPKLAVPADAAEFAIDSGHARFWEPPVKRYVDECLAGRTGPRGKDFTGRWIASLVAEAHRILWRGGVLIVPRDTASGDGRASLLHAAHPIGFLIEQAGGRASTGRQAVLGVVPSAFDQRIGLVLGSRHEVERIERYHHEPESRDAGVPLFAERGLFRD